MKRSPMIDPIRLMHAADALLRAVESDAEADKLITMMVRDDDDTASIPPDAFTEAELVEAMEMLTRMGYAGASWRTC